MPPEKSITLDQITPSDRAAGCLLGRAIGDALAAPVEGYTPAQIRRQYGRITTSSKNSLW